MNSKPSKRFMTVLLCIVCLQFSGMIFLDQRDSSLLSSVSTFPENASVDEGTTSVEIIKYYADGTTPIFTRTLDVSTMKSWFSPQESTDPLMVQGPVLAQGADVTDPTESINLKNFGYFQGTLVQDLIKVVDGIADNSTIKISAPDEYNKVLPGFLVNNLTTRMGSLVVAWAQDGDSGAKWSDGMKLAFLPSDGVLSIQDMLATVDDPYIHYYYDGVPSCTGYFVKNVAKIEIYTTIPVGTSVTLEWQDPEDNIDGYSLWLFIPLMIIPIVGIVVKTQKE